MIPARKLMDHFTPEWQTALGLAARIHHQKIEDLAGAAYLFAVAGKTPGQFQSKIRRECKPKFGDEKLRSIAGEWGIIYPHSGDPLDLLINEEEELARTKKEEEINLGEFDSAQLATSLGISRRMAQIKIRKRTLEIENDARGAKGVQILLCLEGKA
ncbi:MAG: hypothetical protein M1488_08695 [Gammaproteobacteria bacterium]|nr:hypothetical protein [Gammaproteobacteria bacterium]